jgi:DNA-binding NtrC family response regulator
MAPQLQFTKITMATAQKTSLLDQQSILVVDDNDMMLRFWERLFEGASCQCYTTSSPQEALDIVQALKIDAVISDLVMPDMDGLELITQIHKLNPDIKVILTTGYFFDFDKIPHHKYFDLLHILQKPYHNIQNVLQFVNNLLEHNNRSMQTTPAAITANGRVHFWSL